MQNFTCTLFQFSTQLQVRNINNCSCTCFLIVILASTLTFICLAPITQNSTLDWYESFTEEIHSKNVPFTYLQSLSSSIVSKDNAYNPCYLQVRYVGCRFKIFTKTMHQLESRCDYFHVLILVLVLILRIIGRNFIQSGNS